MYLSTLSRQPKSPPWRVIMSSRSIFIAVVHSGITLSVWINDPFTYVLEVPRDGQWHTEKDCAWVRFRIPVSGSRISVIHNGVWRGICYTKTGKFPLDHHKGFKSVPWHRAAFSSRANAERWCQTQKERYTALRQFSREMRAKKIPFDCLDFDREVFWHDRSAMDALRTAMSSIWCAENRTVDQRFERALSGTVGSFSCGHNTPSLSDQISRGDAVLFALYQEVKGRSSIKPVRYYELILQGCSIEEALTRA